MLENTLDLSGQDPEDAARALTRAIAAPDTVKLLVFGDDPSAAGIVARADRVARKTRVSPTFNPRQVIKLGGAGSAALRTVLEPVLGEGAWPRVAVLGWAGDLRGRLETASAARSLQLEKLFVQGESA